MVIGHLSLDGWRRMLEFGITVIESSPVRLLRPALFQYFRRVPKEPGQRRMES